MLDDATAENLRRHWDQGWNGEDLNMIMAPFAEDIVFRSPFVSALTGDAAKTTITGYDALRSYVDYALHHHSGIRYTVDATYTGTDTVVLVYTYQSPDGTLGHGADSMRIDAAGKVAEWRCHYALTR
jgi:hypothetical protein